MLRLQLECRLKRRAEGIERPSWLPRQCPVLKILSKAPALGGGHTQCRGAVDPFRAGKARNFNKWAKGLGCGNTFSDGEWGVSACTCARARIPRDGQGCLATGGDACLPWDRVGSWSSGLSRCVSTSLRDLGKLWGISELRCPHRASWNQRCAPGDKGKTMGSQPRPPGTARSQPGKSVRTCELLDDSA